MSRCGKQIIKERYIHNKNNFDQTELYQQFCEQYNLKYDISEDIIAEKTEKLAILKSALQYCEENCKSQKECIHSEIIKKIQQNNS